MSIRIVIRIDPIVDDSGFAITQGDNRVDVFPPFDYDNFPKEGFISPCNTTEMSAEKAREMATLLLIAADYLTTLQVKEKSHAEPTHPTR